MLTGVLQKKTGLVPHFCTCSLLAMFLLVLPCSVGEPDCLQGNPLVFRDSHRRRKIPQLAPVIVA